MEKQKFPSLNVKNGKISPYGSKLVLRNYHYHSDPKLGPGTVAMIGGSLRLDTYPNPA